ncbi:hypothetical protein L1049_018815 [Liquidambar formosana]|uniref:Uncharacterized protein n=1 Tax=Liquidambar formosana TaxID=63359 RepID=A0AAP0WNN3_LIQFO
MAIRFKFRSSVNFDSVDIEGRPSISVRDLRSKIVHHKNLNISQDLDLVFSDAVTGQEYGDENFQIPSGSSIIIKRVPAGSAHSAVVAHIDSVENLGIKDTKFVNAIGSHCANVEMDNFDDFGVDLCPVPEETLSNSDLEIDNKNNCISVAKTNIKIPRCPEPPTLCQKLETSEISETIPRVLPSNHAHGGIEGNASKMELKLKVEEHNKLEIVVNTNPPSLQNTDLPSELKCSLCNTFFKEAVMIPCCQHSFCAKCIHTVLVEKARCPKCSSTKCRVEDLLPNVSLRQAIDHFLESQILISGSDNAFGRYAPDGESGIQAKDISCAVTVLQREPDLLHSPSATGKGSNQIMAESAYELPLRNNVSVGGTASCINHLGSGKSLKSARSLHNIKQINGERDGFTHLAGFKSGPQDLVAVSDFQGENQPITLPQTHVHEEADSTIKKKRGLWVNIAGRDRGFMETGRLKKGDRACYMCGSTDHLIRDCPAAASPHPMLQTGNTMFPGAMPGYVSPYWNGAPYPHIRPFANVYGSPGMMPFNATMIPGAPFAVPSYVTSIYGSSPVLDRFMRVGGVAPTVGTSAERPLSRSEFLDLQDCGKRSNRSNENLGRIQSCDEEEADFDDTCCYNGIERPHDHKSCREREKSFSYSEDSFTRRSQRKHRHVKHIDYDFNSADEKHGKSSRSSIGRRDRRPYPPERSTSEVEDMSNSSNLHSEERHYHHHRSSKKHNDRREQCCSDSSRSHRQTIKEKDVRRMVESDVKGHHQHYRTHSESGVEPCYSSDKKKQRRGKDSSHSSRHSRHNAMYIINEPSHDRWQMVSGSDEDCIEDYRPHKRKRVH